MRTIAIVNQKGGCGKTTTSINLAACLARLGHKTLLVDMDPQGHCAVGLAVPDEQVERTIYDCMIAPADAPGGVGGGVKVGDVVWQIASDFDLAPSNLRLAAFEQVYAGRPGREDRLAVALDAVRGHYEWCIIDCPPSVGLITFNALRACDEVIVPVETGYFSLHGLTKMMETLDELRDRCDKDIKVRVLPTLYDTRTKLAREVLGELRGKFKDQLMDSTVNFNTKLKEAASFGQPITEYDPGSRGYKDFVNLARELMGHRPVEVDAPAAEKLSRPAELVQRAKQLAQLTNFQFGRNTVPAGNAVNDALANLTGSAGVAGGFGVDRRSFAADPQPHGGFLVASAGTLVAAGPRTALTTQEKIDAFYGIKHENGEVVFATRFDHASRVLIAGDFNNWSPMSTPLVLSEPGRWVAKLPLHAGRYRYRFVVDGQWMTDPHNQYVEVNQFGELNNIVEVA